jgi:single-strand DNA-binding protein
MPSLNRVQLIGYLGKDPEAHYTPNGKKVCNFSIAVNNRWRTVEGEDRETTDWFYVEAWERLAGVCEEYLHKGSLIYVEGRLRTYKMEGEQGETRYFTRVIAQNLQMLDRKSDGSTPEMIQQEIEEPPFE